MSICLVRDHNFSELWLAGSRLRRQTRLRAESTYQDVATPMTRMASRAAFATSGSLLWARGWRSGRTAGSPMLPSTPMTIGRCRPSFSASSSKGSALRPALVSSMPAIVRSSSSSDARASMSERPTADWPVTPHSARETKPHCRPNVHGRVLLKPGLKLRHKDSRA